MTYHSRFLDRPTRSIQEACEDSGRAWSADGRRQCAQCLLRDRCNPFILADEPVDVRRPARAAVGQSRFY
ncbi:MAG: hypothetical protein KDA49_05705 [Rhodospirillaceae bacterium]|nr:hypothetical protein [Rhodospirillaceae bacterium]MCA8931941.1 hypothetical protein [Rhodospirillaceae bacterium]